MSTSDKSNGQFLLGLFSGIAVIAIIGLIILATIFIGYVKKNQGKVAGVAENTNTNNQAVQPSVQVSKKLDKPVVELFVMSHCPYGTQVEKGMLPVFDLLGSKIDSSIKFVYYAMHGEKEVKEQLNQYCIQKDQKSKYSSYLSCFLASGNGASCLTSAQIDQTALTACTTEADKTFNVTKNFENKASWLSGQFPLFDIYKADNTKYSVAGSPTLIINGEEISTGRDAKSLLQAVCSGFITKPSECNTVLSGATPAPGFGTGTAASGTAAADCGN